MAGAGDGGRIQPLGVRGVVPRHSRTSSVSPPEKGKGKFWPYQQKTLSHAAKPPRGFLFTFAAETQIYYNLIKTTNMKRLILTLAMAAALAANAKTLIVYYSFTNNVHTIVSDLRTQIEADVIRVESAEKGIDYAANNYAAGSALIAAIRNNPADAASYPVIDPVEVRMDDYDTVIVAAPLWWSNMAAPLQAFLFNYGSQMAGKNIGLIVSSASSGIGGVVADAKRLIPGGNFLEPNLWIRSAQTSGCHSLLAEWLEDINYNAVVSAVSTVTGREAPGIIYGQGNLRVAGSFRSLALFNAVGSKVMETSDRFVSTGALPPGVYVARIDCGQGSVATRKIRVGH